MSLEPSTRLIPAVALDWGDLADGLTPHGFASFAKPICGASRRKTNFVAALPPTGGRGCEPLTGRLEWRADRYGKSLTKAFQMGLAAGDDLQDMITIQPGPNSETHGQVRPTRWGTWAREQYEHGFNPPMPPAHRGEGSGNCHCVVHQTPARLPTIAEMAKAVAKGPMGDKSKEGA